jgi:hypothetical protein
VAFVKRKSVGVLILSVLGLAFVFLDVGPKLAESVGTRLESVGKQEDDSLAGRGYDRIWNNPGYLLFGAAEGAYRRFDSVLSGEIHSSPATLFFSYGFVGGGIFVVFLTYILRGSERRSWLLLMPTLMYGLTHNGLRFSLLWVTLAFFYCTQREVYLMRVSEAQKRVQLRAQAENVILGRART